MKYIKIEWKRAHLNEPHTILIEIDDDRMEVKRIEQYKNGKSDFASKTLNQGEAILGDYPFLDLEEYNARNAEIDDLWEEDLLASEISKSEFYRNWKVKTVK
ncbi:MAG TPA: hypothetical protein VJ953_17100 [Saprospiraceae bacterium]|nr:hypothetical protein [Saprospiraceae bacterium]